MYLDFKTISSEKGIEQYLAARYCSFQEYVYIFFFGHLVLLSLET